MGERGVELRNQEIAETLRRKGITVVLIDRDIVPFPRRSDFDFVGIDNVQAGYVQAKHLIACGCRRLVYVSHEKQVWTVDARYNGMRNALEECGLPTDGPLLFRGDPTDESFVRTVMRRRHARHEIVGRHRRHRKAPQHDHRHGVCLRRRPPDAPRRLLSFPRHKSVIEDFLVLTGNSFTP